MYSVLNSKLIRWLSYVCNYIADDQRPELQTNRSFQFQFQFQIHHTNLQLLVNFEKIELYEIVTYELNIFMHNSEFYFKQ